MRGGCGRVALRAVHILKCGVQELIEGDFVSFCYGRFCAIKVCERSKRVGCKVHPMRRERWQLRSSGWGSPASEKGKVVVVIEWAGKCIQ